MADPDTDDMVTISSKVQPETRDRLDDHAEEIGENRSTTIRLLLKDQLNREERGFRFRLPTVAAGALLSLGALLFVAFAIALVAVDPGTEWPIWLGIAGLLAVALGILAFTLGRAYLLFKSRRATA